MTIPPINSHDRKISSSSSPPSPSERRPTSFLGACLEIGEMDPDLMLGPAAMGDFQYSRWANESTTAVGSGGGSDGVRSNDGGLVGYPLRRAYESQEMRIMEEANDDDDAAAAGRREHQQPKRRWSTRLSETFFDFGRTVKRRADSLGWGRDSSSAQVEGLEAPSSGDGGSSSIRMPGSGERSREGGDELSIDDDLMIHSIPPRRRATTLQQPPQRIVNIPPRTSSLPQIGRGPAVEHIEYAQPASAIISAHGPVTIPPEEAAEHSEGEGLQVELEARRWILHTTRERLMMMERQMRIAEREGAFTDAGREAIFRRSHARQRRTSEQSQASIKLKKKLAIRQKKSDRQFQKWLNGDDVPWPSRLWNKVTRSWRRSSEKSPIEADLAEEDLPGDSGFESGESGESSGPTSGDDTDSDGGWREDNVEASRFVGWALQSAPTIF